MASRGSSRRSPPGAAGRPLFFEALRTAESRLPAGLVRLGGPARDGDLLAAEDRLATLGRKLPGSLRDLLRSFDGADLFHESVVIFGVGPDALRSLMEANAPPRRPSCTPRS